MQLIAALAASGAQTAVTPQPRLVRAAHEFEAQMMKEILKPMSGSDALTRQGVEPAGRIWHRQQHHSRSFPIRRPERIWEGNPNPAHRYRNQGLQITKVISCTADSSSKEHYAWIFATVSMD